MTERPPTPRELARTETIEQILATAREQLAAAGPAQLSLRAVARDLGMVSSAVYRYFASRDELLTALISKGYEELADTVEQAEAAVARRSVAGRWLALARATRAWSLENPHTYALLFGSPVPGYEAPQDTVASANRPLLLLATLLADGVARGVLTTPTERLPAAVRADVVGVVEGLGVEGLPPALLARGMSVRAQLYGTVSFELFGRYTNGVSDLDAYFEHQLKMMSRYLGFAK